MGESHLSTPYCPSHQRLNQKTYGKKSSPKHRWRVTVLKTAARGMPATRSTLTAMTKDPRVVEAQLGERGRNTDFTGWPSTEGQTGSQYALEEQKMNEKSSRAVRQALRILRKEKDDREARIEYHETVGMLRGLYYGGEIDSMELVALTQLAGSAYINAGKPW
ncbi:hypothetical protein [Pseudomonas paraeruginosa]|uniref:hypothetical protein n=2 Tax=Pseudomonas aeruginosa group TaxID=136841 RepID=UPI003B27D43F